MLALVFVLSLVACGDSSGGSSEIVGTWKSEDAFFSTMTFNSDGSGSMIMMTLDTTTNFDYTIANDEIKLYEVGEKGNPIYIYKFNIDGDTLTITDTSSGSTDTYTKAK